MTSKPTWVLPKTAASNDGPFPATALPGHLRILASVFLLAVPFAAVGPIGLLGNFDYNLALLPLCALSLALLASGLLTAPFGLRGPERDFLIVLVGVMAFASMCTLGLSIYWDVQGYAAYSITPLDKAQRAFIVPLFLALLVTTTFAVGFFMPRRRIDQLLRWSLIITIGYTAIQVLSVVLDVAPYEAIWPFFEGASDYGGVPRIIKSGRVNGPTLEPAEFAALISGWFLPWLVFPTDGEPSGRWVALGFALIVASLSIAGLAIGLIAGVLLLRMAGRLGSLPLVGVLAAVAGAVLVMAATGLFSAEITDRLANPAQDDSIVIRYEYNKAALGLIVDRPLLGVGWSNEVFFFPERVEHMSHLWEDRGNLRDGVGLTARSMVLRIAMYIGVPQSLGLIAVGWLSARPKLAAIRLERDLARTRFAFALVFCSWLISGGIISSFFAWTPFGLCLGVQAQSLLQRGDGTDQAGVPNRDI